MGWYGRDKQKEYNSRSINLVGILEESKADATSCIEDIDKHERELQGSK